MTENRLTKKKTTTRQSKKTVQSNKTHKKTAKLKANKSVDNHPDKTDQILDTVNVVKSVDNHPDKTDQILDTVNVVKSVDNHPDKTDQILDTVNVVKSVDNHPDKTDQILDTVNVVKSVDNHPDKTDQISDDATAKLKANKANILKKYFPEIRWDEFLDKVINVAEDNEKGKLSMSFAGSYLIAKFKQCKMFLYDRNFYMESIAKKIKDVRQHYKQKSLEASIAAIKNPDKKGGILTSMPPAVAVNVSEFWINKKYSVNVGKEGVWVDIDNGDTILDCGHELHVFTVNVDQATIDAILTKAKEKWNGKIEISGDKAFKQKLYHAAMQCGVEVVGYDGGVGIVKEPMPNNHKTDINTSQTSITPLNGDVKNNQQDVEKNSTSSSSTSLHCNDSINLDDDDDFLSTNVIE